MCLIQSVVQIVYQWLVDFKQPVGIVQRVNSEQVCLLVGLRRLVGKCRPASLRFVFGVFSIVASAQHYEGCQQQSCHNGGHGNQTAFDSSKHGRSLRSIFGIIRLVFYAHQDSILAKYANFHRLTTASCRTMMIVHAHLGKATL